MDRNSLKLLQNILFILLLIIFTPILLLLALVSHLVEKPKNERENSESDG